MADRFMRYVRVCVTYIERYFANGFGQDMWTRCRILDKIRSRFRLITMFTNEKCKKMRQKTTLMIFIDGYAWLNKCFFFSFFYRTEIDA